MTDVAALPARLGRLWLARPWLAAALVVTFGAAATVSGAWFFELVVGLAPCPLCLEQRVPYYAAVLLGLTVAASAALRLPACVTRAGLLALALTMIWAASLGIYHAGAEWAFWPGPTSCAAAPDAVTSASDLLRQIQATRVVDCTVVAWRFLGLSLAGWNVVAATILLFVALYGAAFPRESEAYGSSSVSQ